MNRWIPDGAAYRVVGQTCVSVNAAGTRDGLTFVAVVSDVRDGARALLSMRFLSPLELPAPVAQLRERIIELPQEWFETEAKSCAGRLPLDPGEIAIALPPSFSHEVLTGHLMCVYSAGVPWVEEDRRSLVRQTARLYKEFSTWGETSAPTQIARLLGASPMTIRNRLSEARMKGWLESPGHGSRRARPAGTSVRQASTVPADDTPTGL